MAFHLFSARDAARELVSPILKSWKTHFEHPNDDQSLDLAKHENPYPFTIKQHWQTNNWPRY